MIAYGVFEPAGPEPPKAAPFDALEREALKLERAMAPLAGTRYDGPGARKVCVAWCGVLGLPVRAWELVDASLQHLQGRLVTGGVLRASGARLREHLAMLRAGLAIPLWGGSPPAWALVEVVEAREVEVWSKARTAVVPMTRVSLRARSGPLAGGVVSVLQTPGYGRTALRELGVSKYARAVSPLELFRMRGWALLETAAKGGLAAMMRASGTHKSFNRRLYRSRYYERPEACHRQVACHKCGMTVDRCPLACRPADRTKPIEKKE